ncbi:HEPN domain-containing protein [Pyrobaculum sp. 3827-6]|nr:HEPN domain-containing protein [Pyrobaculum sp. 3827-6]MCU7786906.1 HEPN domain-containing protein [Pyrobaculum sp. 3827-6]
MERWLVKAERYMRYAQRSLADGEYDLSRRIPLKGPPY